MLNYLAAERLKQKHSFNNHIIWILPFVTIIIAYLLMGPVYFQADAFNWWYIFLLPFTFTFLSASIVKKDTRNNYHGLFNICIDKKQLWYAKIGVSTYYLLLTNLVFYLLVLIMQPMYNFSFSMWDSLIACLILFITFAWQIPLFQFLTQKTNMFVTIILSLVCNIVLPCIFTSSSHWILIPFCIPARLMCAIIRVAPNGLLIEPNNYLLNKDVIGPGIIISLLLYILLSFATARLFKKQEV